MKGFRHFPAETLMRWYAEMNSWATPADMPVVIEQMPEGHLRKPFRMENYPKRKVAWDAICSMLTEEQTSWGWWKFGLEKSYSEWADWWASNRKRKVTINELGEPK